MGQELVNIKKRIKSVNGAYKITKAMKLVSNVKLQTYRNVMATNKEFQNKLSLFMDALLSDTSKLKSKFIKENNSHKNLYIIVSSSLGLCGSYNQNVFKLGDSVISNEDDLIVLGKKAATHYSNKGVLVSTKFLDYNSIKDETIIRKLADYILKEYLNGEFKEIHLIYTSYINPITFNPVDYQLLPIKCHEVFNKNFDPIFEPSRESLFDSLVDFYIKGLIHCFLLESEVCEQASRSNAMDNATKNAEDLLENLKIQFNKARQASITQEIVEVSSASNV